MSTIASLPPPIRTFNDVSAKHSPSNVLCIVESLETTATSISDDIAKSVSGRRTMMHCECVLALHMIHQKPLRANLSIGASKACCWPCTIFLAEFSEGEDYPDIHVSNTHCKTYSGWEPPLPLLAKRIHNKMVQETELHLVSFLQGVQLRKRSDSQYASSGEGKKDPKLEALGPAVLKKSKK